MRLIFCGTPQFAVPSLKHLIGQPDIAIVTVITQPDRPKGRGREITYSPVKQTALDANIPVYQPARIRGPESQALLESLAPDAIVIIAYGQIIPARLLTIPKLGWINLHASLLPKYRGAAPINWAIVNGETISGLTTMRIDAGMDTGDVLLQKEISVGPKETAPELAARMSEQGAPLMRETLHGLQSGAILPRPQDHTHASMAPLLKKEDARIDWQQPAQHIFNRMRGFAPWPGASSTFRGESVQLSGEPLSAKTLSGGRSHSDQTTPAAGAERPGTILVDTSAHPASLLIVCGHTTLLHLHTVKREGRKQISASEFANGARLATGDRFV